MLRKVTESFMKMRATEYLNLQDFNSPPRNKGGVLTTEDTSFFDNYQKEKEEDEIKSLYDVFSSIELEHPIPPQYSKANTNDKVRSTVRPVLIKNKKDLYEYLRYDFS